MDFKKLNEELQKFLPMNEISLETKARAYKLRQQRQKEKEQELDKPKDKLQYFRSKHGIKLTFAEWFGEDLTGKTYKGNIKCVGEGIISLKGAPAKVTGNFIIDRNPLETLEYAPEYIGGHFEAQKCELHSLEGCPRYVGGDFKVRNNHLTSLMGAPEYVGGNFDCELNELTDLKGFPKQVKYSIEMSFNPLKSIIGCPEQVAGDFSIYGCEELESLKGAPKRVEGWFNCQNTRNLISLQGAPEYVGGFFTCSGAGITSLVGAPKYVGGGFDCISCKNLQSLEGAPDYIGGNFKCIWCNNLQSLEGLKTVKGRIEAPHNLEHQNEALNEVSDEFKKNAFLAANNKLRKFTNDIHQQTDRFNKLYGNALNKEFKQFTHVKTVATRDDNETIDLFSSKDNKYVFVINKDPKYLLRGAAEGIYKGDPNAFNNFLKITLEQDVDWDDITDDWTIIDSQFEKAMYKAIDVMGERGFEYCRDRYNPGVPRKKAVKSNKISFASDHEDPETIYYDKSGLPISGFDNTDSIELKNNNLLYLEANDESIRVWQSTCKTAKDYKDALKAGYDFAKQIFEQENNYVEIGAGYENEPEVFAIFGGYAFEDEFPATPEAFAKELIDWLNSTYIDKDSDSVHCLINPRTMKVVLGGSVGLYRYETEE